MLKPRKKYGLFYAIAVAAIDAGRQVILSDDDTRSTSESLGGALLNSYKDFSRLSLTVYPPEAESCREEAEDDNG